ncbi:fungal-specific transcription factor domain-containing protein [Aspergillus multicolor]|uniref:fungal specific transcription factor domain-containing protein n=1 Tax=Aspergillus multicolor TaxID=41759 RepID=UPI003CCD5FF1
MEVGTGMGVAAQAPAPVPSTPVATATLTTTAATTTTITDPTVLIDAFFHHVHRAYPFIDEERIRNASLEGRVDGVLDSQDPDAIILFMIMVIGYTSLQRSGQAPPGLPASFTFAVPYATILQRCIMHESLDSIQILVLLTLYSLFDACGPSPWSLVGIITRQAQAQGLTRAPPPSERLTPKAIELRRRLFWSIYGLDRMVSVSVGSYPGFRIGAETDIDITTEIPLPAITVAEFASPHRAEHASMLQVTRHVIDLRCLEARILSTIHLQRKTALATLTLTDRNTLASNLRAQIENWYSHGCLIARPELDNVRLHDTLGWLNARYYHLLLLLYYPCAFNARGALPSSLHRQQTHGQGQDQATALLQLVRKFTQYNRLLLAYRQLPLNRVTLSRLFPACLVLLYCVGRGVSPFSAHTEARALVEILESFSESWHHAQRLARILAGVSDLVTTAHHGDASDKEGGLRSLRAELVGLTDEALGRSNCYQDMEDWNSDSSSYWEGVAGAAGVSYTRAEDESPNMTVLSEHEASMFACSFL